MNIKKYKLIILPLSITLLGGCASISNSPFTKISKAKNTTQEWNKNKDNLKKLNKWDAEGVIGIQIDKKGQSANYIWHQNSKNFTFQVYGPLGIDLTTFKSDRDGVEMISSSGAISKASSIEKLMYKKLGWYVPIEGLYYWGRGIPYPNHDYTKKLNKYGTLQTLNQDGWDISYSNYKIYDKLYPLAKKLKISHGKLKITAVVESWNIKH